MNSSTARGMLLLATIVLLPSAEDAMAQRNSGVDSQQGGQQQGGSQFGSPTLLGNGGQNLGQRQQGQFGQGQERQQGQGNGSRQQRRGGQDGFIGNDARQMRNDRNQRNANQPRRSNFNFSLEDFNEARQSRRQQGNRGGQKLPLQIRIRPLFSVPSPAPTELLFRAQAQVNRALPATAATTSISISGHTATIVGTVQSPYDKRLVARVLSLQPGILKVENKLTVH